MKRNLVLTMVTAALAVAVITVSEARSSDATGLPTPKGETCSATTAAAAPPGSVFQGCWTFFAAGPCRAVYRDASGQNFLCGKCGPTGQPNPNSCGAVSTQTLATGFWCS